MQDDNNNQNSQNIIDSSEKKEENVNEKITTNNNQETVQKNSKNKSEINLSSLDDIKFSVLKDDYPVYDLSFKVILIGESGK